MHESDLGEQILDRVAPFREEWVNGFRPMLNKRNPTDEQLEGFVDDLIRKALADVLAVPNNGNVATMARNVWMEVENVMCMSDERAQVYFGLFTNRESIHAACTEVSSRHAMVMDALSADIEVWAQRAGAALHEQDIPAPSDDDLKDFVQTLIYRAMNELHQQEVAVPDWMPDPEERNEQPIDQEVAELRIWVDANFTYDWELAALYEQNHRPRKNIHID
ncbi:MAG: hypothetical protein HOO67_03895 [Candidatus Peribacteraceae bacterium]|nr:hypothetical protein [Candidatus Peribacteraceae bacterium]